MHGGDGGRHCAPDGRSPRIRALEETASDEAAFKDSLPEDWAGAEQVRFLREWASLKPSLADEDLRAVSHLSRDTVALAGRRRGLSEAAAAALTALAEVKRLPSPAADRIAQGIPPGERAEVLAALIAAMRRHKNWSDRPPEVNGALVLARLDGGLRGELARFLEAAPGPKRPPWIGVLLGELAKAGPR